MKKTLSILALVIFMVSFFVVSCETESTAEQEKLYIDAPDGDDRPDPDSPDGDDRPEMDDD